MSEILGKTLSSLPSVLVGFASSAAKDGSTAGFRCFVNSVKELKTKHAERNYVLKELSNLQKKLSVPNQTLGEKKECLIRLIFCHMLGYDVSFAFIHALKLAQQGSIHDKRTGYLACGVFLNEEHELVTLLINTLQKDLKSSNSLVINTALIGTCQLIGSEMIPLLLPLIQDLTSHDREYIRVKAVMCLHKFLTQSPGLASQIEPYCKKALSDHDVSVMGAALHIYTLLVKNNPNSYSWLVEVLVGVLDQIIQRRLSSDCEYHTVPAPWISIKVLKLLASLHYDNNSYHVYEGLSVCRNMDLLQRCLSDVLTKTESSHKIGLAVIYECLITITAIAPDPNLLQLAAKCISKFLSAQNLNLKYLGIKALSSLVSVDACYALQHQTTVMECLQHPDPVLKNKTLELLYCMANSSNVDVICNKQLEHLNCQINPHQKQKLLMRVLDLCERHGQSLEWYVMMLNRTLVIGGDLVPHDVSHKLLLTIQSGMVCSDGIPRVPTEPELRKIVHLYSTILLSDEDVAPILLQVSAWVCGEYHHLVDDCTPSQIVHALVRRFQETGSMKCKGWILTSLIKMCSFIEQVPSVIDSLKTALGEGHQSDLKQRLFQLEMLCSSSVSSIIKLKPQSQYPTDEMDLSLSFLDAYVCEALEKGAQPYKPLVASQTQQQLGLGDNRPTQSLIFTPYQESSVQKAGTDFSSDTRGSSVEKSDSASLQYHEHDGELELKVTKRVWGRAGVNEPDSADRLPLSTHSKTTKKDMPKEDLASALFSGIAARPKTQPQDSLLLDTEDGLSEGDMSTLPAEDVDQLNRPGSYDALNTQRGRNHGADLLLTASCDKADSSDSVRPSLELGITPQTYENSVLVSDSDMSVPLAGVWSGNVTGARKAAGNICNMSGDNPVETARQSEGETS